MPDQTDPSQQQQPTQPQRSRNVGGFYLSDYTGNNMPTSAQDDSFASWLNKGYDPAAAANYTLNGQGPSAPTAPPPTATAASVSTGYSPTPLSSWAQGATQGLLGDMSSNYTNRTAINNNRDDSLYATLTNRAQQSLNVSPNDPVIASQVNPYRAEQIRDMRNSVNDLAEQSGPMANLGAQRRLMTEDAAHNTANMQGTLMANELANRRAEIQQALSQMGGQLSNDQQLALQGQLGTLNGLMQQQGLGLQQYGLENQMSLGQGGLNNQLLSILMQNQLGNRSLNSQNEQFGANLGLQSTDRAKYWDWLASHPNG